MLSYWVTGLTLCLTATLANIEAWNDEHHPLIFYHDAKINGIKEQLFKEALQAADLDPTGIKLEALREKTIKPTTYTKAFFVNRSGMDCQLDYSVAIYNGMRIIQFCCVNTK